MMSSNEQSIIANIFGTNGWKLDPCRNITHDDILSLPVQHVVSYRIDGMTGFLFCTRFKMWIWYPKITTPIIVNEEVQATNDDIQDITLFKITFKNHFIFLMDMLTLNGKVVANASCITERVELIRKWLYSHGHTYTDPIQVTKWKSKYPDSFMLKSKWTIMSISLYHPIHTRYLWAQKSVVDTPFDVVGMEFKQVLTSYIQNYGLIWTESDRSIVRLFIDEEKKPYCLKYGRKRQIGQLSDHQILPSTVCNTIQNCFYRNGKWVISHECEPDVVQPDPVSVMDVCSQHINIRCFGNFQ